MLIVNPGNDIFASHINELASGWFSAGETWTYASADAPTFTFTISGDKTSKYSPGMRIKLTQTTVKYFIITAVSYSSPNTTITIYGGTDYTLADAAITSPFYAIQKTPAEFPLDPRKWTVEVKDTTRRNQSSPTQNAWYNLGNVNITIPVGLWDVEYSVCYYASQPDKDESYAGTTLSTENNSESDSDFSTSNLVLGATATSVGVATTVFRRKVISLTEKTIYYLNTRTLIAGTTSISNYNDYSPLIIRAICAYL